MLEKVKNFFEHEWPFYLARARKKYYIIRRPALGAGFFSNYWWIMGHVVFAHKLGYIPVVDMQNYKTLYSEDVPVQGEWNAWNYYFENVGSIGLQEAYDSGKYVLAEERPLNKYGNKYCEKVYRYPTEKTIDYYYPIVRDYMVIKPAIRESFESEWNEIKRSDSKVLGIHVRGTDMRNNMGHPVPATLDKYIECAEKILDSDVQIGSIFLATDEESVIAIFQNYFEQRNIRIYYNKAFRSSNDSKEGKQIGIHETELNNPREMHKYLMGLEVLKDAWFLSECDYLLCGHSNITNVVLIWNNNKFEDVFCLNE